MTQFSSYIICTTPRSGSTLLCSLLRETGRVGDPQSYFHGPELADWRKGLSLPADSRLGDIIQQARLKGAGGTGLFGLRLQRNSFAFWMDQLAELNPDQTTDTGRITAAFGSTAFIYLTREDKIAQAVSLVRATQSGLWHRNADGSERERLSAPQELRYDGHAIARELAELTALEGAWQAWFAREGITPLTLNYDRLAAAPAQTVGAIFKYIGLDPKAVRDLKPSTAILADEINTQWAQRFASGRG